MKWNCDCEKLKWDRCVRYDANANQEAAKNNSKQG